MVLRRKKKNTSMDVLLITSFNGSRPYMCSMRWILELGDFAAITPSRGWRGSGFHPRNKEGLNQVLNISHLCPEGAERQGNASLLWYWKYKFMKAKIQVTMEGLFFFKLLHFGKCAHHLKRMIYKDWHLPDPHKNRIFTHKTVELQQLVDGS